MPKRRILIVDDEADIRAIVRATLTAKYEVVEAHDGLDAAQKLDLVEPDLVVLDVMMPLMDGYDTCTVIRNHPRFHDIPVLFLSALASKPDIVKGYGAGANLYLTKPFEPARLLRVVDMFFEEKSPPWQAKRFTIEELQNLEKSSPDAIAEAKVKKSPPPTVTPPSEATSSPPKAEPAPPPPRAPRAASAKPRVVIVDDDEDVVAMTSLALMDEFEVAGALDGLEGIHKIVMYEPDIIVLDVMLPKMSGYQLCQSIRRNKRFAHTPIVIVSAKSSPRDQEYALRIGANAFVGKPFDPEQLRETLRKLTQEPGFVVHPKAMSWQMLQFEENRRRKQLEEQVDKIVRKQETELEKFLREHGHE